MSTTIDDLIFVKDSAVEFAGSVLATLNVYELDSPLLPDALASDLRQLRASAEATVDTGNLYDAAEGNDNVCSMEEHEETDGQGYGDED